MDRVHGIDVVKVDHGTPSKGQETIAGEHHKVGVVSFSYTGAHHETMVVTFQYAPGSGGGGGSVAMRILCNSM